MRRKTVLLGPYPPPHGGVAIFTSALFEFTRDKGVELWAAGESLPTGPNVRPIRYKRLGLIPLLLKEGFGARIVDSFYFLIEYPNPVMVPIWVILKFLLRFEWIKVVHDGSLPSRYSGFGPVRKLLFRLSVSAVDEFVVVNDGINEFLRNEIGTRQDVTTVNALLPIPGREWNARLPGEVESALGRYDRRVVSCRVGHTTFLSSPTISPKKAKRRMKLPPSFVRCATNPSHHRSILRGGTPVKSWTLWAPVVTASAHSTFPLPPH